MAETRKILRFALSQRIEHIVALLSFTLLAITGLTQKYATAWISTSIVALVGGVENLRLIHRLSAIALAVEVVYHIGAAGYRVYVLRQPMTMLPSLSDLRNAWLALRYNLGLTDERPQQGRFTFEEKAEYWAFVWGTIIMAITGFMMWNPIATTRFLPGEFIPAAKAAHGGEALLAVLAIIVWHFYHVHLRHFNKSMFTGYLTEEEMLEEHPLELADLKSARPAPDPEQVARRRRRYFPTLGLVAGVMLVGIYLFATFEQTAITTIPPAEDVVVFAPLTPTPLPTQPPSEAPVSWEQGFADLFGQRCGACHGAAAAGGLNVLEYDSLMNGGASGPAIVPGDPEAGTLIRVQSEGNHPGQLSGEELAWVRAWIEAGAP